MERRKFLIGAGALGAGASAALGTGAFTTVRANRSVTVGTVRDGAALLSVTPTGSANSEKFVTQESNGTVSVSLPNVNEDAVTFRSGGDSIDGQENARDLVVGEKLVAGIEIDALNDDVSGSPLSSASIVAEASTLSPDGFGDGLDLRVGPTLDDTVTDRFDSIGTALDTASSGETIGIEPGDFTDETGLVIDTPNVELRGPNYNRHGATVRGLDIVANGVTITGLKIDSTVVDSERGNGISMNDPFDDVTIENGPISGVAGTGFDDPEEPGSDVAVNGIDVDLNGSSNRDPDGPMSSLVIKRNEDDELTSLDGDSETTATGVRIDTEDEGSDGTEVSRNAFEGITAESSVNGDEVAGDSEARGVTVNNNAGATDRLPTGTVVANDEFVAFEGESVAAIGSFEDGKLSDNPDDRQKRVGPVDFEIRKNVFDDLNTADIDGDGSPSPLASALFVGGYENLGDGHVVENNDILSGAVVRFAGSQDGFVIDEADELDTQNDYWGASDGSSGEFDGSGRPALTGGEDDDGMKSPASLRPARASVTPRSVRSVSGERLITVSGSTGDRTPVLSAPP